jgi:hypothetical protein
LREENPSKSHQKQKMAYCHKLLENASTNRPACHSLGSVQKLTVAAKQGNIRLPEHTRSLFRIAQKKSHKFSVSDKKIVTRPPAGTSIFQMSYPPYTKSSDYNWRRPEVLASRLRQPGGACASS